MSCESELAKLDNGDFNVILIPHNLPIAIKVSESCEVRNGIPLSNKEVIGCVTRIPFPSEEPFVVDCSGLKNPEFKISGEPKCRDKSVTCGCSAVTGVWGCPGDPVRKVYNQPGVCESVGCKDDMSLGGGGVKLKNLNNFVAGLANEWCTLKADIGLACGKTTGKYKIGFPTAKITVSANGSHVIKCTCSSAQAVVPFSFTLTGYVPLARELTIPSICTASSNGDWVSVSAGQNARDACGVGVASSGPHTPRSKTARCAEQTAFFCCPKQDLSCTPAVGVFKKTGANKKTSVLCRNSCNQNNAWYYDTYTEPYGVPTSISDLCDMEENGCLKGGNQPAGKCGSPFRSTFRASDLLSVVGELQAIASYGMSTLFANLAFQASAKALEKVDSCNPDGNILINEVDFGSASGSFGWGDKPEGMKGNIVYSYTVGDESFGPVTGGNVGPLPEEE